ncbi:MAG: hypothetical protein SOV29_06080 [Oscillospiraceae bacterium]|nr:hypothetical protein [Oscillospiraceae bacterium]
MPHMILSETALSFSSFGISLFELLTFIPMPTTAYFGFPDCASKTVSVRMPAIFKPPYTISFTH